MPRTDDQGRRLCHATTRAGNPCRSPAMNGAVVCRMHGGSSPQAKEKARQVVLEDLVNPALLLLLDVIEDPDAPTAPRVAAARDVLDRTGYKAPLPVTYDGPPSSHVIARWIAELEAEGL